MNKRVSTALEGNTDFTKKPVFGIPGSWLNREVFPLIDFLKEAPFLRTMIENPNHIGCHTSGESENFFKGTHQIEKEVIRICAEEILCAQKDSYDGYIATGGTEGNLQAIWAFRNYLIDKKNISPNEIGVIYSSDTHYSLHKACNLMCVKGIVCEVNEIDRQINQTKFKEKVIAAKESGIKEFIAVLSMGTTMFGSVDDIESFTNSLKELNIKCMIHIDAAFGGFIFPFSGLNQLNFNHPDITSFSLDGHKMLQSPYGTGVFLIRKPFLDYVSTNKASYVKGFDKTLCGSRSGALSVAMWMIFSAYGSEGWNQFLKGLLLKTKALTDGLKNKNISYFNQEGMNVITIKSGQIDTELLKKYHWVSDNDSSPNYYKAVIMDHVSLDQIKNFLKEI